MIEQNQLIEEPETLGEREAQQGRKIQIVDMLDRHPFRPFLPFRNRHIQTVGARYGRFTPSPDLHLERLRTRDDDFLRLHTLEGDMRKPVVLVLHGLEGSVESAYMLGIINEFAALGWTVAAMEHRSCGGEMNRAKRLYHTGETSDLAFVVETLIRRRPDARIYIVGYSMGGNQIGKWLGSQREKVPKNVRAAAIVSAPFDLVKSAQYMDSGIRLLYVRHFLRMLIPKAIQKEKQFPGCLNVEAVKLSKTFHEFDTHATAVLHGFRDAPDYYSKVGCGQFLKGIRRPTLLLSAADDPFNPGSTLPRKIAAESPYLHPLFPDFGGHVGFMEGLFPMRMSYWAEKQIARFFQAYESLETDKSVSISTNL